MGKKDKEKKMTPIYAIGDKEPKEVVVDPRERMTNEEIQAFMEQEEKQLAQHLERFLAVNPQKPNPVKEEKDDEEEVFTLDLANGVVTQNLGEGLLVREDGEMKVSGTLTINGDMTTAESLNLAEPAVRNLPINDTVEYATIKHNPYPDMTSKTIKHNPYPNMISNMLVSKAVAQLLKELNTAEANAYDAMFMSVPWELSLKMDREELPITKYKNELRKAWSPITGNLDPDLVPEWAKPYINQYIHKAISALTELV